MGVFPRLVFGDISPLSKGISTRSIGECPRLVGVFPAIVLRVFSHLVLGVFTCLVEGISTLGIGGYFHSWYCG